MRLSSGDNDDDDKRMYFYRCKMRCTIEDRLDWLGRPVNKRDVERWQILSIFAMSIQEAEEKYNERYGKYQNILEKKLYSIPVREEGESK